MAAGEPLDRRERQVAALELRVRVQHDSAVDGIGDGAEVGHHAIVRHREVGLEDREDAGAAEPAPFERLAHRIRGGRRGDAGGHRHAAGRRLHLTSTMRRFCSNER